MSKRKSVTSARRALARTLRPEFFRALSDPNRLALLVRLARCGRACTVSELNECCPIDGSVVSRHLSHLRNAGVVESTKKGKMVYYRVRTDELCATLRTIADALDGCCSRQK